jgi:DNA primase
MFPIFDSAGRVVAYSGRILNDDGKSAKYLNSPQTELFDKSKILYAYDRAKHSIRKFDFSILVEGQMDLLMAHQAGFTNTVASSGTALTENHLSLLKRISNKIIMSFDSDDAGAKASERAWAIGISSGMDIKVAIIPKGYDPAELILKGLPENSQSGKDLFKDVLKKSVHLIDFLIDRIMSEETDQRKVGLLVKQSVLPYIALLESTIEKAHYVKRISEKTNIQETAIWEDLKNIKVDQEYISKSGDPITKESVDIYLRKGSVERSLAGIMSEQKNTKGENHLDILNIEKNLKDIIGEEGYSKFEKERVEIESELAFEAEGYYSGFSKEKMEKEIDYLLLNIREDNFKTELNKLLFELKQAEQNKETEKIQSLSIRLKEIMGILSEIKSQKNKVNK